MVGPGYQAGEALFGAAGEALFSASVVICGSRLCLGPLAPMVGPGCQAGEAFCGAAGEALCCDLWVQSC